MYCKCFLPFCSLFSYCLNDVCCKENYFFMVYVFMSYLRFSPLFLFYKLCNFFYLGLWYNSNFCNDVKWVNSQFLKIQISSSSSSIYRKDFPFTHWIALTCLGKMNLPNIRGSISGVTVLFQWSLCLFFYQNLNFWIFILNIIAL